MLQSMAVQLASYILIAHNNCVFMYQSSPTVSFSIQCIPLHSWSLTGLYN